MNDARSQFLTAVFQSLRTAVVAIDHSGRITFLHRGHLSGSQRTGPLVPFEDDANYLDYLSACGPGAAGLLKAVRAVLEGHSPGLWFEYPHPRTKPGRWFVARIAPLRRSGGGAVISHVDVTPVQRTRAEIEAGQERYRTIFEAAGVGVVEVNYAGVVRLVRRLQRLGIGDLRGCLKRKPRLLEAALRTVVIRDINEAALQLVGAPDRAALRNVQLKDLLGRIEESVFLEAVVAVAEQRRDMRITDVIRTFRGEERHAVITVRIPEDVGTGGSVLVCFHDVTDLHHERRRYEMATAASGVVVYEYMIPEQMLVVDARLTELLGLPHGPLRRADWLARIHPADAALAYAHEREMMRSDAPRDGDGSYRMPELELRVVGSEGAEHWFLIRGSVIYDSAGIPERVFGTMTDITEHKVLEEAVRMSQDRLLDLAARLIAVQEQERIRIARDLEHDLNRQLGSISETLGHLALDVRDAPVPVRNEVKRLAGEIAHVRMAVAGLSDAIQPQLPDTGGFAQAIRSLCEKFGRIEGLAVALRIGAGFASLPRPVSACLYRVAQEALHNAARHSGSRSAEVTLSIESGSVVMRIRDFGSGFDWQLERPWSGLGLTSMRERVRLAGGEMTLTSHPGSGTDVRVSIPLREDS